jgi:hypothetical protein
MYNVHVPMALATAWCIKLSTAQSHYYSLAISFVFEIRIGPNERVVSIANIRGLLYQILIKKEKKKEWQKSYLHLLECTCIT